MLSSVIPSEALFDDHYEVISKLGEGTFASVYKVSCRLTGDQYAVKQVEVHPLERDEAVKEIGYLSRIESDHVVKLITSFFDNIENCLNVVMELAAGSLRQKMNKGAPQASQVVSFMVQIVSAFLQLSSKKVMHLDLKPENILISRTHNSYYKLCDFGCSQLAMNSKMSKYTKQAFGTFNYLAPENTTVFNGKKTSSSADVWSLGVIIYEMLYQRHPFPLEKTGEVQRSIVEQFLKNSSDNLISYDGVEKDCEKIIPILKKMLKPKPEQRLKWAEIQTALIEQCGAKPHQFVNLRRAYFKHTTIIKVFLSMLLLLRKNLEFNPHNFWKTSERILHDLSKTLLHLCYLYTIQFQIDYSYKIPELLTKEEQQNLKFLHKNIGFEESKLIEKEKQPIPELKEILTLENLLYSLCINCKRNLERYSQNYWEAMYDLEEFCNDVIRSKSEEGFFANGDDVHFGRTMHNLQISI